MATVRTTQQGERASARSPQAEEIFSNGSCFGYSRTIGVDKHFQQVGDRACLELMKLSEASVADGNNPRAPLLYGRVIECVIGGEPVEDSHLNLLAAAADLRTFVDELSPQVGDVIAVEVAKISGAGRGRRLRFRYGVARAEALTENSDGTGEVANW